jgi:hypothetical protein
MILLLGFYQQQLPHCLGFESSSHSRTMERRWGMGWTASDCGQRQLRLPLLRPLRLTQATGAFELVKRDQNTMSRESGDSKSYKFNMFITNPISVRLSAGDGHHRDHMLDQFKTNVASEHNKQHYMKHKWRINNCI